MLTPTPEIGESGTSDVFDHNEAADRLARALEKISSILLINKKS